MFLQEFQQGATHNHQLKKARKEYSAGFRNYHPNKHFPFDDHSQNTEAETDIFEQLKIGNLKQLYQRSQPIINHQSDIVKQQQKSILRLTSRPQKKTNTEEQQSKDNVDVKDQHKFQQTYHKVPHYEQSANSVLFKSQFKKIETKLRKQLQQKSSSLDFITSIVTFILTQQKALIEKDLHIDNLILQYTNFINHNPREKTLQTIQKQSLQSILHKNLFLYSTFKIDENLRQIIDYSTLEKLIRSQQQINTLSNDSIVLGLLNKKYTVPYQNEQHKSNLPSNKQMAEEQQQPRYVFHANAVPSTTYHPAKQRPKSSVKAKTTVEPFNLTVKEGKKVEDYYKWDRNFKPLEIPKTTYEPQQIVLPAQSVKKKRAAQLLQSAAFPSTMKYLQDYNKYSKEKQQQLRNRYWRNHQTTSTDNKIPNFQQIHYQQMMSLQTRKTQNRHVTKPQPFNLSQPKPPKHSEPFEPNQQIERQLLAKKKVKKSNFIPQSTLKYQAYVKHIRDEKQQRQRAAIEAKKKVAKVDGEKKALKQILKQRIDQQLGNLPKNAINPQSLTNNSVKVNLEKIYSNQPLLIERETAKSKKVSVTHKKDWSPII